MDFLLAVAKNDLDKVRHFLQSGFDVNTPILWNARDTYSPVLPADVASRPELRETLQPSQEYHCRPLNIAVLGGYADMARLLLSAGADINLKDGRGRTALVCAIYGLDLDVGGINTSNLPLISQTHERHLDIMKNIIMCHPNIYVSTLDSPQFEIQGITPLCLASYLGKADIIRLLLDDGRVNVDGTDSKSATPLMYAARDGNLPIVKILLSYNASPDITDNHGWSAIQYAGLSPEIVQLYEEALRCKRHELAHLHGSVSLARYPLNYNKLSTLIASLPEYPSSLSHLHFNTLKDIDLLDPTSAPVVQLLRTAFLQAIKNHDHNTLRTLLLWSPPLSNGQRAMSGPLLVNYHDSKTGMTALHHAMRTKLLPSLETIALLYQAGADINSQTYYGRTALHHLARFGVDKDGKSWGIQKSNKGESKAQSPTPPHRNVRPAGMNSASSATSSVVTGTTAVGEDDANRYSVQSSGSASSSTTARGGGDINDPIAKQIMAAPTVPQHLAMCASLLIRLGALVNIADPTGNTPLHFAAEFGGVPEVLEVLIMEGNADLTLKNKKGLTPVDVSRTEEVRKCILALEHERKISLKTKSSTSYMGGNIRPLETASDCRSVLSRSVSRSTLQSSTHEPKWRAKRRGSAPNEDNNSKKDSSDADSDIETDFENILKAFFCYQTTFTDSIESALAKITDSILNSEQQKKQSNVGQIISRLRYELREAHKMFDDTEERAQRVMLHYRQELEQIEQIYQSDLEMSELQGDKVDKLLDVFERIENRFSQLEMEQDEMIHQVEKLRQAASRRMDRCNIKEDISDSEFRIAIQNLSQSLVILDTVSVDPVLYTREDIHRLWHDMGQMVERAMKEMDQRPLDPSLSEAQETIRTRWDKLRVLPSGSDSNSKENESASASASASSGVPAMHRENDVHCRPTYWQRQLTAARLYHQRGSKKGPSQSLNELELAFDIQHANLNEVQKDLDQTNKLIAQIVVSKREVYDACLRLESELDASNFTEDRSEAVIRSDLEKVLRKAKLLFDKQKQLEAERSQLRKELIAIEKQLDETCRVLRQVRPPVLLQGLLERLESDEAPIVRIEKDWKEDSQFVTEVFEPEEDDSDDTDSSSSDTSPASLDGFTSELSLQCLITRLDASLYSLKVLAKSHIGRSRQMLMDVQTALSTSSAELEETRQQMNVLYDDAAEVAHQVFTLKTELETIIRHRKEEIVKVWEVVEEVSEGIEINPTGSSSSSSTSPPPPPLPEPRSEAVEDQDRHQWIVRELEQLQNVHENLQEAIEDLQRDQEEIAQTLRQLATAYIEPQVNKLVGQDDASLLAISDRLTELLERIRQHEFGVFDEDASTGTPAATAATTKHAASSSATSRPPVAKWFSVASLQSSTGPRVQRDTKRVSTAASVRTDRKRMSIMSNASFTSLSSYQQDRMLARASTLSSAFSKSQHSLVPHRVG